MQDNPLGMLAGKSKASEEIFLIISLIWARKAIIFGTVMIVMVFSAIALYLIPSTYKAEAVLVIDGRKSQVVEQVEEVLPGLSMDLEALQTELQIIASPHIADMVIDYLGVLDDPTFDVGKSRRIDFARYSNPLIWLPYDGISVLREILRMTLLPGPNVSAAEVLGEDTASGEPVAVLQSLDERALRQQTIYQLLAMIDVDTEQWSRAIRISAESRNPQTAAKVANGFAEMYIQDQINAKAEATRAATSWLLERVEDMRLKVETAELAVENYRQQYGLIQGRGGTLTVQEISELNAQLIAVRGERATAEAKLEQVETIPGDGGVSAVAQVLSSPLIEGLRQQEATLQRKLAELTSEYGDQHPRIVNSRAELMDLRGKLAGEVSRVVNELRHNVRVAAARERSLEQRLDALKSETSGKKGAEVGLRALEREAEANRRLFEIFLIRLKETSAQQEEQQIADARIIAPARVPLVAAYPNKRNYLAVSFFFAVGLGCALVLLVERLDYGYRNVGRVEDETGFPVLSLVPQIKGNGSEPITPEQFLIDEPNSEYTESLRTLYSSLLLTGVDQEMKFVMVCSAVPHEGKSSITASIARLYAREGKKVLLMDCDLRRPRQHMRFGLERDGGIVDILANRGTLDELVKVDPLSGLHVLTAGSAAPNPAELLLSQHMAALMTEISEKYELVLLDSPASLVVGDASILARYVDHTVFVVRWGHTKRKAVIAGLRKLEEEGDKIAGIVLSSVDLDKQTSYGYGYGYGYGQKYGYGDGYAYED